MKRFHDEDMQRAWDEAKAAERELEKDPERKQRERERLIRGASDQRLSASGDEPGEKRHSDQPS